MTCVETPRLSILWNGGQFDWINPGRGIRQGDPISPYIFVLCIERHSHLIKAEVAQRKWKWIKLSRYGPELSHLLFGDDMVLFAEASEDRIKNVRRCLEQFEDASDRKSTFKNLKFSSPTTCVLMKPGRYLK